MWQNGRWSRRENETKWSSVWLEIKWVLEFSELSRGCRKSRCLLSGSIHLATCALSAISKGWLELWLSSTPAKFGIKFDSKPKNKFCFSFSHPNSFLLFFSCLCYFLCSVWCLRVLHEHLVWGKNYLYISGSY